MNRNSNDKKQEYLDLAKAQKTTQDNAAQGRNPGSDQGNNSASGRNRAPTGTAPSTVNAVPVRSNATSATGTASVTRRDARSNASPTGFMPSPSYVGNPPFRGSPYPPSHSQGNPGVSMHQPQQPFPLPRQPYNPSPAPGSMGQSQWNYGNTVLRPADPDSNQPALFPGSVTSFQLPNVFASPSSHYGGNTSQHENYGYEDSTAGHQSNHRGSIQATDEFQYNQLHEESANARALGGADEYQFDLTNLHPEMRGESSFEEPNTQ